jgi:hypothetical protein
VRKIMLEKFKEVFGIKYIESIPKSEIDPVFELSNPVNI